jgi:hypothetical protein
MRVFRPDDEPDRPHGIMLLRERLGKDGKAPVRMRVWPVVSMLLILLSGIIGTPTPALHGEGLVTLLGGGTLTVLIAIEIFFDPQDDRANFVFILLLGLSSIALMTVQPSGTAVLGTYAAVASAVIRLPKRWAIAAIVRRRANCSPRRSGRVSPATRRPRSTSAAGSPASCTCSPTRSRRSRSSSRGRASWRSTATSTPR